MVEFPHKWPAAAAKRGTKAAKHPVADTPYPALVPSAPTQTHELQLTGARYAA